MTHKSDIADLRGELRSLHKLNPETAKGFSALSMGAMSDGTLDKKSREFIALVGQRLCMPPMPWLHGMNWPPPSRDALRKRPEV